MRLVGTVLEHIATTGARDFYMIQVGSTDYLKVGFMRHKFEVAVGDVLDMNISFTVVEREKSTETFYNQRIECVKIN